MSETATATARPQMDVSSERSYTLGLHLSGLCLLLGIPGVVGPLVMWIIKKDESAFVDAHGKAAVNFQLSMLIYFLVSIVLVFVIIGIFALIVLGILAILFPVLAAVKAQNGEMYDYPMAIPFLK